jgi:hypothetical protein
LIKLEAAQYISFTYTAMPQIPSIHVRAEHKEVLLDVIYNIQQDNRIKQFRKTHKMGNEYQVWIDKETDQVKFEENVF